MAHELNKFFQARRKFGIDMPEASRIFGEQRALELASGRCPFLDDDARRLETYAGQKERDRKAAQEAARAEFRRFWG